MRTNKLHYSIVNKFIDALSESDRRMISADELIAKMEHALISGGWSPVQEYADQSRLSKVDLTPEQVAELAAIASNYLYLTENIYGEDVPNFAGNGIYRIIEHYHRIMKQQPPAPERKGEG